MSRSRRARALEGLLLLVLLGGSLRTVPVLDRALLGFLAPARLALDLVSPDLVAGADLVPAHELLRRQEGELAHELAQGMRAAAQPRDLTLGEGVRGVQAEVLGRPPGRPDSLQILLADPRGLERGAAVVAGDVFLGSLTRIPSARASGRAGHLGEVKLLTARDARVSGVVLQGDSSTGPRLVVGGIRSTEEGGRWYLAVHHPEDEGRTRGKVVLNDPDPLLAVANGWFLGRVALEIDPLRGGQRVAGLETFVDHEAGLSQVLVLSDSTEPAELRSPPPSGEWLALRRGMAVYGGDRSGFPLLGGSMGGLRSGAAVADGVRLVGRVLRATPLSAMVRGLDDPGFSVHATAVLEKEEQSELLALGRIVSRGLDGQGRRLFLWEAERHMVREKVQQAQIWTQAGEAGVPGGLLLGTVSLPFGPGPHILAVEPPPSAGIPTHLRVFVDWEGSR